MTIYGLKFLTITIAFNFCGALFFKGVIGIGRQIIHIISREPIDRLRVVTGFQEIGASFVFIVILAILFFFYFVRDDEVTGSA